MTSSYRRVQAIAAKLMDACSALLFVYFQMFIMKSRFIMVNCYLFRCFRKTDPVDLNDILELKRVHCMNRPRTCVNTIHTSALGYTDIKSYWIVGRRDYTNIYDGTLSTYFRMIWSEWFNHVSMSSTARRTTRTPIKRIFRNAFDNV